MKVFISTGEVSGDIVGGLVTQAVLRQSPRAHVFGIGGAHMQAAGAEVLFEAQHLGTVGITETIGALRHYPSAIATVRRIVRERRPDVALLIGNDLFHAMLARWLRSHGVRTIAYFPPQVWIWRSLVRPIARSFDSILTSFPEEQAIYERAARDTDVRFVGHYLTNVLTRRTADEIARARASIGVESGTLVALMPGSRSHEIELLLPAMLGAAGEIVEKWRDVRFVLPIAHDRYRRRIEHLVSASTAGARITLVDGASREAIVAADLLIVASGTATLEAALLGVPMVIVYKLSAMTAALVRGCIAAGLIDTDIVGLPNRILGGRRVPEILQRHATPRRIADEAIRVLQSESTRAAILADLAEAARLVSAEAVVERVADRVLSAA